MQARPSDGLLLSSAGQHDCDSLGSKIHALAATLNVVSDAGVQLPLVLDEIEGQFPVSLQDLLPGGL